MKEYQSKNIAPKSGEDILAKARVKNLQAIAVIANKASTIMVNRRLEQKTIETQQEAQSDVLSAIKSQQSGTVQEKEIALKTSGSPIDKIYNSTLLAQSDEQYKSLLSSKAKTLQSQYQADPKGFRFAYDSYYKGLKINNPILQLSAEKYARQNMASTELTLTKQSRRETGAKQKKTTEAKMATLQNEYAINLMTNPDGAKSTYEKMQTFLRAGDRLFPYSKEQVEYYENEFIKGATTQMVSHAVEQTIIQDGSTSLDIEELFSEDSALFKGEADIRKTLTTEEIDELRTDSIARAKEHKTVIKNKRDEDKYREDNRQFEAYKDALISLDDKKLTVDRVKLLFKTRLINPTQRKDLLSQLSENKYAGKEREAESKKVLKSYIFKLKQTNLAEARKAIENDDTLLDEDKIKLHNRITKLGEFTNGMRYKAGKELINNEFKMRLKSLKDSNGEIPIEALELQRTLYAEYFNQVSVLETPDQREANAVIIAERSLNIAKTSLDTIEDDLNLQRQEDNKEALKSKALFRKGYEDLSIFRIDDSTKVLDNTFNYFDSTEVNKGDI